MSLESLRELHEQLFAATHPEDIFSLPSELPDDDERLLEQVGRAFRQTYRALALRTHPDRYEGDLLAQPLAREAFARLSQLYQGALQKLEAGSFGDRMAPWGPDQGEVYTLTTPRATYTITAALAQGDLSTVYAGHRGCDLTDQVAIKIADDPANNDLLQLEVRALRLLHADASPQRKHLPQYYDQLKTSDQRVGIVLQYVEGYDLISIREKYVDGIPPEHIIWIFRRVLSVLGYAHKKGILHGNVSPEHILIRPYDHNVSLIDWSSAILQPKLSGDGFKTFNPRYSAPEVAQKKPPLPSADLFSLGRCMIYLLGGDPETGELPARVDDRLQRFLRFFIKDSPIQRAQDAWELYHALDTLRKEIYGPHRFLEFEMP